MPEQKLTKTIAHLVFLFLFIYAAYFHVERMACDTSFFTFKILSFEKFNIEAGRYATFVTQIIPLVLIKLHASLKAILISYSVSFIIVFYLLFLVSLYIFSSLRAALAATFVLFLGISDTSLYSVTEIFFGMSCSILFYGFLEYFFINESKFSVIKKYSLIVLGFIIVLMCRFSHPATFFPVIFILAFETIDKKLFKNKIVYFFALVVIIAYSQKFFSIEKNSYEGDQISQIYNIFSILGNFNHLYSIRFFLKFLQNGVYILPVILFVVNLAYYLVNRNYIKLIFTFLATSGYFVLLMVIFSRGDSDLGMERNLISFWIFIALPFIHDILCQEFRNIYLRPIIYSVIMVVGLGGFYRAADYYRNRRNYMKQLIEKASNDTNSRKIIIERNNIDMDRLGVTWSFANETLLISSLEGPENSKTIYLVDNLEELKNYDMKKTDVFLCVPFWLEWNYSSLNPRYFRLPREPYCILEDKIEPE